MQLNHGSVTTSEVDENGKVTIEKETFYAGQVTTYRKEYEESIIVTRQSILGEIIEALKIDSDRITITVEKDKNKDPRRMIKRWTVDDDHLRKRT